MSRLRVAVVYVGPKEAEHTEDLKAREEVDAIARFLSEGGHQAWACPVESPDQLIDVLQRGEIDFVFNFCRPRPGRRRQEMHVVGLYELFHILYIGSSALTVGLCENKGLCQAVLHGSGTPTPRGVVIDMWKEFDAALELKPPWIVKAVHEHSSIGIEAGSVVFDEAGLRSRVDFMLAEYQQPALVQEFIDGREFTVPVLETSYRRFTPLPIVETVFENFPEGSPHIFSYNAKFVDDTPEYRGASSKCPADLAPELAQAVRAAAVQAAQAVGIQDYGRIDLRVRREDNAVFVIDVNPNCDFGADSDFVLAARVSGRSYAEIVCEVLQCAIDRYQGI